jgi:hypothetical protein
MIVVESRKAQGCESQVVRLRPHTWQSCKGQEQTAHSTIYVAELQGWSGEQDTAAKGGQMLLSMRKHAFIKAWWWGCILGGAAGGEGLEAAAKRGQLFGELESMRWQKPGGEAAYLAELTRVLHGWRRNI